MTRDDRDLDKFSRLVEALRPWLGQIIIIGGRAHELFRLRPEASALSYPPLRTDDADVALNPRTFGVSTSIRDRLKAFGFSEEFSGDVHPPVTHYSLGDDGAGFYAEFLTPLIGGERRRDGSLDVTERVAGVVAQKLRHLDVLMLDPWTVTVSRDTGFDVAEPATIQIPNPASYLVQKLLIHRRRKAADRAKDVLYIHDTIELFAGSLPTLHETWRLSIAADPARLGRGRRSVPGKRIVRRRERHHPRGGADPRAAATLADGPPGVVRCRSRAPARSGVRLRPITPRASTASRRVDRR